MPLVIEDSSPVEDAFRPVEDAETIAPDDAVIVSLERWIRDRHRLLAHPSRVGVILAPDDDPEVLAEDLERLNLILLQFPQFTDGRAYSQARVLRGRLGFRGRLRATGDVLPDQLPFMRRCGIDSFAFRDEDAAERFLQHPSRFSVLHQAAHVEGVVPSYRHRA